MCWANIAAIYHEFNKQKNSMAFVTGFYNCSLMQILTGLWPPHSPDITPCGFFLWDI
jgi:hypothetical protein